MKYLFFIFSISLLIVSCKKEKVENSTQPSSSNGYSIPSTTGSYWIYSLSQIDSLGNVTAMSTIDTVTITGTEIINGHTYIVYEGTYLGQDKTWYERDSSGFIVNSEGLLLYSTNANVSLYNSEEPAFLIQMHHQMGNPINLTHPLLGSITALDRQMVVTKTDGSAVNPCNELSYTFHSYYTSGVGLIESNIAFYSGFLSACKTTKRELTSYYIAP